MNSQGEKKTNRTCLGIVAAITAVIVSVFVLSAILNPNSIAAKFRSEANQAIDVIVHPTKPVFSEGSSWYRGETPKSSISTIIFADCNYTPESYTEMFYAGINNRGTIKCYVTESESKKQLIISGNGWTDGSEDSNANTVYANANSSSMFEGFASLKKIYPAGSFCTDEVSSSDNMFYGCTSLTGGAGTPYSAADVDIAYAHIDTTNNPGYYTGPTVKILLHKNVADSTTTLTQYVLPNKTADDRNDYIKDTGWEYSGYDLIGWATTSDATEPGIVPDEADGQYYYIGDATCGFSPLSGKADEEPVDLYAVWKIKGFTVYFDAQDGEVSPASKEVIWGENYGTLPVPVKTGYMFNGWSILPKEYAAVEYIKSHGTEYIDTETAASSRLSFLMDVNTSNILINTSDPGAIFGSSTDNKFFAKNSSYWNYAGSTDQKGTEILKNTRYLFEIKNGKLSIDGTVKASGGSDSVFDGGGSIYLFADNKNNAVRRLSPLILYSCRIWRDDAAVRDFVPCKIISSGESGLYDLVSGRFFGRLGSGAFAAGENSYIESDSVVTYTKDHTLTALWTPATYSVALHYNDGKTPDGTMTVAYGEKYGELPVAERVGYTFEGWYDSETGGTQIHSDDIVTILDDTDIFAHWSANNYTVSFDPGTGGFVDPDHMTVTYGNTYGELPVPSRDGYDFVEWNAYYGEERLRELPAGYIQVEYLESFGNEYIDTAVAAAGSVDIQMDVKTKTIDNGDSNPDAIFGSSNSADNMWYSRNGRYWNYKNIINQLSIINSDTRYLFEITGGKFFTNGTLEYDYSSKSFEDEDSIYLFADNNMGSVRRQSSLKLYSCVMKKGGDVIRDFVPCKEESSGKFGLYDLANDKFYENASGTGAFAGGPLMLGPVHEDTKVTLNCDHTLYATWKESSALTLDSNYPDSKKLTVTMKKGISVQE